MSPNIVYRSVRHVATERAAVAKTLTKWARAVFPASFLLPLGLLLYGWGAEKRLHWIVPGGSRRRTALPRSQLTCRRPFSRLSAQTSASSLSACR